MTVKEYIIKLSANVTEKAQFVSALKEMTAAATKAQVDLADSAQVINHSIKSIDTVLDGVATNTKQHFMVLEQNGKRFESTWTEISGSVDKSSISFKQANKFIADIIPTTNQATQALDRIAKAMSTVTAANLSMQKLGNTSGVANIISTKKSVSTEIEKTVGGADISVPVQKQVQVLQMLDGTYKNLTTTITRHATGQAEIKRAYSDNLQYAERLQKAETLRAERLAILQQKELGAASAAAAEAKALAEQKLAADAAAASLGKLILTEQQAELEARKLANGLSANAKLISVSQNESLVKGTPTNTIKAAFDQGNGRQQTVTMSQTAEGIRLVKSASGELADATGKAGINISQLVSRAAVTIPVWYALRSAVMGFLFGLRDGVTNILTFDAALQKLRANLDGTHEEVQKTLGGLKKDFTALSLQTGVSVEDITNSFQRFATVGFNVDESMTGAVNSVKLATAFFASSTETADAFARSLRVLTDQSQGTASTQKQMAEAMQLTAELWNKNAFEVGEMNQGLEKFAAQANVSKLSMKETLVLLATMGTAAVGGARGGTLLRTSLADLATHAKDVAAQIGVQLNPALDTNYTALHKVVDALSKMNEQDRLNIETTGALSKIFGGVRGSLPIEALIAMNKLWRENEQYTGSAEYLNRQMTETLDSESGQAKILGNQIRELAKSFVQNVAGGNDFAGAIKNINEAVKTAKPIIDGLAASINGVFTLVAKSPLGRTFGFVTEATGNVSKAYDNLDKQAQASFTRIIAGLRNTLSKADLDKLKIDFASGGLKLPSGVNTKAIGDALSKALSAEQIPATIKVTPKVEPALAIRSLDNEFNELKARLKSKGATDIQLSLLDIEFEKSKGIQDINKIRDDQSKARVATIEKERSIQDALLQAVEEGAKAEGASTLEAINRRLEMERDLGIQRTGMDLLNQQLGLQRALTEESKKTKKERLDELQALVKKTLTPEQQSRLNDQNTNRESILRDQALNKGISKQQIESILNPEKALSTGNSLLQDLQTGLTHPMTQSMGSLEGAINFLTQAILKQETQKIYAPLPQLKPITDDVAAQINKPGSAANRAVNKAINSV